MISRSPPEQATPSSWRSTPRGGPRPLAYLVGLVRTLTRYRAPRFGVTVDGQSHSGRYWITLAAIGPYRGGGMRLAPSAQADDGFFDLVMIEPMSLGAAIRRLPGLYNGRLAGDPAVHVSQCRSATIRAEPPCGVKIDGQDFGTTPVTVSLLPGALNVLDCRASAE